MLCIPPACRPAPVPPAAAAAAASAVVPGAWRPCPAAAASHSAATARPRLLDDVTGDDQFPRGLYVLYGCGAEARPRRGEWKGSHGSDVLVSALWRPVQGPCVHQLLHATICWWAKAASTTRLLARRPTRLRYGRAAGMVGSDPSRGQPNAV